MVAEQTTMAMGTLVQAMQRCGVISGAEADRVEAVMDEMYQAWPRTSATGRRWRWMR